VSEQPAGVPLVDPGYPQLQALPVIPVVARQRLDNGAEIVIITLRQGNTTFTMLLPPSDAEKFGTAIVKESKGTTGLIIAPAGAVPSPPI
jgi:hypothetical protein